VYNPISKKIIDENFLIEEYNCNPNKISENFILYKSILGDGSDKIPGIPKCGVKTSSKLARQMIDNCVEKKLKEKFLTEEYLGIIERNKKLIDFKNLDLISTISIEENISFVKETFKIDREKAFKTLRNLEINTLYSKLIDFVGV
jgi:5'-3' exonuclease